MQCMHSWLWASAQIPATPVWPASKSFPRVYPSATIHAMDGRAALTSWPWGPHPPLAAAGRIWQRRGRRGRGWSGSGSPLSRHCAGQPRGPAASPARRGQRAATGMPPTHPTPALRDKPTLAK
eukprot:1196326-Prorocentrum_minimum.AAC.15